MLLPKTVVVLKAGFVTVTLRVVDFVVAMAFVWISVTVSLRVVDFVVVIAFVWVFVTVTTLGGGGCGQVSWLQYPLSWLAMSRQ